jgi:hypothetical protein
LCGKCGQNILSAGDDLGHGIHPILISMMGNSAQARKKIIEV